MRLVRFVPALLVLFPAVAAQAQKPVLMGSAVSPTLTRINLEDYSNPDFIIDLEWTVTGTLLNTYQYELTYDRGATELTMPRQLCLDTSFASNDPQGPAESTGRVRLTAAEIVDNESCPARETPPELDRATRAIVLRVYLTASPYAEATSSTYVWNFDVDTQRPPAPIIDEAVPGENRVQVRWSQPSSDIDVKTYQVLWCHGAATSSTALPCDSPTVVTDISKTQTGYSIDEGVENGMPIAVAVRAVDEVENIGPLSGVMTATPREVDDFFEFYKGEGGAEDGGFCFIATAAYGSYAHPAVRLLRAFRDDVLKRSPLGTLVVWTYYHLSPPIADAVRADPSLRSLVRAALVPVASVAVLLLLAPFAGLAAVGWVLLGRRRRRASAVAGGAVLALAVFTSTSARAESFRTRRTLSARPDSSLKKVGLGLELKGGPYLPKLAESTEGPDATFGAVFGKGDQLPKSRPLFGLGLDLQLFRGFGSAGIGGGFGFLQFVGKSRFPGGAVSSDTTVFNELPLSLTAFYRFDVFADRANIPFVPYVRGGLAYHVWWVTNGNGSISKWDDDSGRTFNGRGGKLGLTGTVGVSFLLNVLEPTAARNLFEATSVRGTYLFGEYQINKVDGFGAEGFDFSDSTWNVGLYLEL